MRIRAALFANAAPGWVRNPGKRNRYTRPGRRPAEKSLRNLRVLFLEPINPPSRVHQLLLSRIERVADGADLNVNLLLGGHGSDAVTAGAYDGRLHVIGMNSVLHVLLQVQKYERARGARLAWKI